MADITRVCAAACDWRWCSLVVVLLATTSSLASSMEQEAPPGTLVSLVSRLFQNLPSLKQALYAPRPALFVEGRSRKDAGGHSQAPAPDHQCFSELGCLSTGNEFHHSQHRPINLMAEAREVVNVTFRLYTREAPQGSYVPALDVSRILSSSFRAERPTKMIIHGYLNGRNMPWLEELVKVLLEAGDFNVMYVDWTGGSLGLYSQAVANARLAGLEIAHLIRFLESHTQLLPRNVHLIGHSLGAHLAGYAGERVTGLGRITGLDPAEPLFEFMPPSVRLDPSDALLVDVIHTDAGRFSFGGGYGLEQAVGHLDFYPNGGVNQPGCQPPLSAPFRWIHERRNFSTVWDAVEDALGCNHIRAVELFIDSVRSQCPYVAFRCPSFRSFTRGECFSCGKDGSGCVAMGLHADSWQAAPASTGQQLYLVTGPQDAPCVYHYRALLEVSGSEEVEGLLQLTIVMPDGHTANFDLTAGSSSQFQPRQPRTFLLQHSRDLGTAQAAHLSWTCSPHYPCHSGPVLTKITLLNIEQFIQRRRGRHLGLGVSGVNFCATEEAPLRGGEIQVLSPCQISHHQPWQSS
ncbi:pancreatic triacylglycerol lipase-like isoform X1 [Portunus trituberculatus]|uniref:pancreatic triacylglycerol lipase-like isoform X1 n=2 Tax=Portunus trituberculatus TaxID=210409 RepID=UPI001E1D03C0|nr:pancreatic triacylglycerol lipase-like isoform X1 [Portunus trituberculatus]